jgi:hypothetical protein
MSGDLNIAVLGSDGTGSDGDVDDHSGDGGTTPTPTPTPDPTPTPTPDPTPTPAPQTDATTPDTAEQPESSTVTYDISSAVVKVANKVYTGSARKPAVTVTYNGKELPSTAYKVTYSNNINAGKASVSVKGISPYTGSISKSFTISKAANKMTAKAKSKTITVKYSKVKKSAQTIKAKNAFIVKNAKGKVTYTKKSGNKKIKVSSSGKVTIGKKLKKGTYSVKVKIKADGTSNYKSATKTITLKIKIK